MIFVDWFTEAFNTLISFLIKHRKKVNVIGLLIYLFSFLGFLFVYFTFNIVSVAEIYINEKGWTLNMIYWNGFMNALMNLFFIGVLVYLAAQIRTILKAVRTG